MVRIIPRKEWGAKHKDGFYNRRVGRLDKYLHHTVTTHLPVSALEESECAHMRNLESIGQNRFGGGISYTFIIFPSGRVYEGHSIGRVGAHTAGHNSTAVGIALAGNYETGEVSEAQFDALVWLLREGVKQGWWTESRLDGGHRDVKATACPGKYAYAQIPAINAAALANAPVLTPEKVKEQKSTAGKSIQQMASEVRAGKHGNGHDARRQSLGVDAATYALVRAEVNKRSGVTVVKPVASTPSSVSIAQMAAEVIAGHHGTGHEARRKSLGVSQAVYEQVRTEVNRRSGSGPAGKTVSQMATEVLQGRHGNGHAARQRSLGVSDAVYAQVRAEVNRRSR